MANIGPNNGKLWCTIGIQHLIGMLRFNMGNQDLLVVSLSLCLILLTLISRCLVKGICMNHYALWQPYSLFSSCSLFLLWSFNATFLFFSLFELCYFYVVGWLSFPRLTFSYLPSWDVFHTLLDVSSRALLFKTMLQNIGYRCCTHGSLIWLIFEWQVKWSGVQTQHMTTPFVDDMYDRLKDTLNEYEVIVCRWPEYTFVLENVCLGIFF